MHHPEAFTRLCQSNAAEGVKLGKDACYDAVWKESELGYSLQQDALNKASTPALSVCVFPLALSMMWPPPWQNN